MKILMIAPTPFSASRGTHLRITHEALGLRAKGHHVTITTYHIGDTPEELVAAGVRVVRISPLLFWYKKREAGPDWQKIFLDILLLATTVRIVSSEEPDVIHGHLHEGVAIGWLVRRILFWKEMKLIGDFHGTLVEEMTVHGYLGNAFIKKIFRYKEKMIHKMPDRACASTGTLAALITRDRSDVVPVVYDAPTISGDEASPSERRALRSRYGVPDGKIAVLYTGGFTKDKGINSLIVFTQLLSKEDLYWIFAGSPQEGLTQGDFSTDLAMQIISPLTEDVSKDLMVLSDIAIDPKQDQTGQGSGKVMNYMNAGLPVACFDSETNRDILGEKMLPLLARSEEDLAEVIRRLAGDSVFRRKFALLSKERTAVFSWEQSCVTLEKLYE